MITAAVSTSNDHSEYIEQVYEDHRAGLRHYFLRQAGNVSEADDYVQETIRRFFVFMADRDWEAEGEYILVYLMRIAGVLCLEKLSKKRSQCTYNRDGSENKRLFNEIRDEASQTSKERIEFKQFFLSSKEGNSGWSSMA